MKNIAIIVGALLLLPLQVVFGQVGIGTKEVSSAAVLELVGEDKGTLLTKVALEHPGVLTPITGEPTDVKLQGLLVYNITANGFVSPGFYVWTGVKWERVLQQGDTFNEKQTKLLRREDNYADEKGYYDGVFTEPKASIGSIVYKYIGEDGSFFMDIGRDITRSLTYSESARQAVRDNVLGVLKERGQVYYGTMDPDLDTPPVFYYLDAYDVRKRIKLSDVVGEELGGDSLNLQASCNHEVTSLATPTGMKVMGKPVYSFFTTAFVKAHQAAVVPIALGNDVLQLLNKGQVYSIKMLDEEQHVVDVQVSDIKVANGTLAFSLGQGGLYIAIPEGRYGVIVEFLSN